MSTSVSVMALMGTTLTTLLACEAALGAGKDLGNGFRDLGVATPVSNHRGIVATRDGDGHDTVLIWLYDHRGGYALLDVDVETGECRQVPMPFSPAGDCPYASILSSRNRFYTHFAGHFTEYDPTAGAFTFQAKTKPQMAMSMTEDDAGRIWSVTYPNSGVVCYDPKTGKLRDYGWVNKENWRQYPRSIAADDAGWIYFGIGNTASQIVSLDPVSGKSKTVVSEKDRMRGSATVSRDMNGKVYGHNGGDQWYELYRGEAKRISVPAKRNPKVIITGSQGLVHRRFPDGRLLKTCDTVGQTMTVFDPKSGKTKTFKLDYTSDGAYIMGIAAAPDGTLCGGTAFPMRFFSYNPATDHWINRAAYGQWNTVARQGDRFFVGGYTHGFMLEWDPAKPWVPTVGGGHHPETIGWGYTDANYYHFKGKIDEVRIYSRALSVEEIAASPEKGLAACWHFSEGKGAMARDSSGNDNHGKIQAATWGEGKSGTGLEFDGKTACVTIPDADSLQIEKAITVSAWIYPTPPHQHGYGGILNNIAGRSNNRLLVMDDGALLAQIVIGGKKQDVHGPEVKNHAWNHVAYVYDGSHEYWVVNGVVGKKYAAKGDLTVHSNPKYLADAHPDINRPHDLLAMPDGKMVILAGTPGYGYTGGGLLFWDRTNETFLIRTHRELLPEQATQSLAPLPDGNVMGGSTTRPGTGGELKAKEAELYILDLTTKKIVWHAPVFPGVQGYTDLCPGPRGLIYGVADQKRFFVFDPRTRRVIYERNTKKSLGLTNSQQGPRVFVATPDGDIYMLFQKGIAQVDPESFAIRLLAASPVTIGPGGDYYDGCIYFGHGSHLYSWRIP